MTVSTDEAELVRAVLTASTALASVSFALLVALIALASASEAAGRGERGIRPMRLGSRLMLAVVVMALVSSGLSFWHLAGWADTYDVLVIVFPGTLVALALAAVVILILT